MGRNARLEVRLAPADAEVLDRLAAVRGRSRSAVVRELIAQADGMPAPASEPPDLERIVGAIAEKAYGGSVEAARLIFSVVGKPSPRPASARGASALVVQLAALRERRREALAEELEEPGEVELE